MAGTARGSTRISTNKSKTAKAGKKTPELSLEDEGP